MPPMPRSVKPRPMGMGWNPSAVMKTSIEKPLLPSGGRVATSPNALSVMPPRMVERRATPA